MGVASSALTATVAATLAATGYNSAAPPPDEPVWEVLPLRDELEESPAADAAAPPATDTVAPPAADVAAPPAAAAPPVLDAAAPPAADAAAPAAADAAEPPAGATMLDAAAPPAADAAAPAAADAAEPPAANAAATPAAPPAIEADSAVPPANRSASMTLLEPDDDVRIGKVPAAELQKAYNLVVIGGGPAGVAAALKAAMLGRRVLLVDKPKAKPEADGLDISFGGPTGLFSKALREAGKCVDVKSLKSIGLYDSVIWSQIQGQCVRLASMNAQHQVNLLRDFKVGYLQATATIVAPGKVLVFHDGRPQTIATDNVLVATGSRPFRPAEVPFDDKRVFDSDTVNTLDFLPKSVAIAGGGIISIEYAKIFRKLGAKVTLLVRDGANTSLERIGLDRDIADQLLYFLRKDDVQIYEKTSVAAYNVPESSSAPMTVTLESPDASIPSELECDIFLAAIGRRPNVSGLGLEKLGVKLAQRGGHIEVDGRFESSVPGIYACGDVIGPPSLASTGVHQAQGAVVQMFDEGSHEARENFPVGMWTTPECAYYG
eukprot:CAMPEP_0195157344 /NCGR_PEP_ID=MMETSP0448-20130528/185116_1 /TAXON_ID=66468 /ORGANISM="Heterocapsa triquestra, Strain CCMP 448" /LENGTH=546 /DNA_ID=CAMNT_0040196139 /DNA_START=136 /DNA_END=1773 /DNA_ORIENTATION=-